MIPYTEVEDITTPPLFKRVPSREESGVGNIFRWEETGAPGENPHKPASNQGYFPTYALLEYSTKKLDPKLTHW